MTDPAYNDENVEIVGNIFDDSPVENSTPSGSVEGGEPRIPIVPDKPGAFEIALDGLSRISPGFRALRGYVEKDPIDATLDVAEMGGSALGAMVTSPAAATGAGIPATVAAAGLGGQTARAGASQLLETVGLKEPTSAGEKFDDGFDRLAFNTALAGLSPTAVKATAKTLAKTFNVTADAAEYALKTKAPEKILKMLGATKNQLTRTSQKYLIGTYEKFEKQFPEVAERVFNNRSLTDADKFIQVSAKRSGKNIENFFTKGNGKNLFIEESEVLASPIIARVEELAKSSDVPEIRSIASDTLSTISELYKTRVITDPRGTSKAVAVPASRVWKAIQDLTTKLPANVHSSDGPAAATDLLLDVQNSLRATIRSTLDKAAAAETASGLSAGIKKVSGEMDLYHYLKSFENLVASAAGQEKATSGVLKYLSPKSLPRALVVGGAGVGGGYVAGPGGAMAGLAIAEGAANLNTHAGRVMSKHAIDYIQGLGKAAAEVGSLSVDQAAELQKYAAIYGPAIYNVFEAGREEPQLLPRDADEESFLTISELASEKGLIQPGETLADMTEEETEVVIGQVMMSPEARGKFQPPPSNSYAWDVRSYYNGKVLDENERELVRQRIKRDSDLTLEQKASMLNPLNKDGTVIKLPKPPKIQRRIQKRSGTAPSIVDVLPKGRGVTIVDFVE